MPLLSRKADYALLILSHLSDHPNGANAREIAERFDLSRPFVANILKELGQHQLVVSHRGVKGGYFLAPKALTSSLAQLLDALEESFSLTQCSSSGDHESCSLESACPVKNPLKQIHRRMIEVLRSVSLAELFSQPTGSGTPAAMQLLHLLPIRSSAESLSPPPVTTTL